MKPITSNPIPAQVLDTIQAGDTIAAIKLLRDATGVGLKEAKDIIDAHLRGQPVAMARPVSAGPFPPPVVAALQRGDKIEAIKLLREHTGLGLKEAINAVHSFLVGTGAMTSNLSPGEIPRSGNALWWITALIIASAGAWYLFKTAG